MMLNGGWCFVSSSCMLLGYALLLLALLYVAMLSAFFSSQWIAFSSSQMLSTLDYSSNFLHPSFLSRSVIPIHVLPLTFPTILLMDSLCNRIYIISLWIHTSIDRPLAFLTSFSLFHSLPFPFPFPSLTSNSVILFLQLCTQLIFLFNLFLAVITPCMYTIYPCIRDMPCSP
jgi:hypothetical protein